MKDWFYGSAIALGIVLFYALVIAYANYFVIQMIKRFMKRSEEIQNQLLNQAQKEIQDGTVQMQRKNSRKFPRSVQ